MPAVRFAREALTSRAGRPAYAWAHVRERLVATDALVSIDGARYSVPAALVGATATVTVREHASDFTIWHAGAVVATHGATRVPPGGHAARALCGLLRVDRTPLAQQPPQYDPRYPVSGDVAVRDLTVYERFAESA